MLRHLSPNPKRSATTTRKPSSARWLTIWEPIKPAPPVTTTRSSPDKLCILGMTFFQKGSALGGLICRNRALRCCVLDDDTGDNRSSQGIQKREKFLQLVQPRVGDVDDVLVLDGKPLGKEIGIRIAHIEAVNNRR